MFKIQKAPGRLTTFTPTKEELVELGLATSQPTKEEVEWLENNMNPARFNTQEGSGELLIAEDGRKYLRYAWRRQMAVEDSIIWNGDWMVVSKHR